MLLWCDISEACGGALRSERSDEAYGGSRRARRSASRARSEQAKRKWSAPRQSHAMRFRRWPARETDAEERARATKGSPAHAERVEKCMLGHDPGRSGTDAFQMRRFAQDFAPKPI